MTDEKDWLVVVHEVNLIQDDIKKSAQKIMDYCNNVKNHELIDKEFLEILSGFSKIGTLTTNAKKINDYSRALSDWIELCRHDVRFGEYGIKHAMNQVCATGFDIERKGKKFEIQIPKLDFNLQKLDIP